MANIDELIEKLQSEHSVTDQTVHWERQTPRVAQWAPWPADIQPDLQRMLARRGHQQLYTHQREVWELGQRRPGCPDYDPHRQRQDTGLLLTDSWII